MRNAGLTILVVISTACGAVGATDATSAVTSTVVVTTSHSAPTAPTSTTEAIAAEDPAPEPAYLTPIERAPVPRVVIDTAWRPFAVVGGITLVHPSNRVERIGFHQSTNDGARQPIVLDSAASPIVLESRSRDTGPRGAADVVVDPESEIRAPVTGTVVRSGTYVLYCDYSDDFAVIEPDAHAGWEVKILHIDGVMVAAGDRVVAGETVLAPRATRLPFRSQVDDFTAAPSWPHVHIEVVDPSIPDRPGTGSC